MPATEDDLIRKEIPTPTPGAQEVLIEIEAASLNFPDLLIVQNKYQLKPPLPFVPGAEYAGIIRAVGEDVNGLAIGTRVACFRSRIAATVRASFAWGSAKVLTNFSIGAFMVPIRMPIA